MKFMDVQPSRSSFIREQLFANRNASRADVEAAWISKGYRGGITATLFYQIKSKLEMSRRRDPRPTTRWSKAAVETPKPIPLSLLAETCELVHAYIQDPKRRQRDLAQAVASFPVERRNAGWRIVDRIQWDREDCDAELLSCNFGGWYAGGDVGIDLDGKQVHVDCACGYYDEHCDHAIAAVLLLHAAVKAVVDGTAPSMADYRWKMFRASLASAASSLSARPIGPTRTPTQSSSTESRLIFRITERGGDFQIEPVEQTRTAKGAWSTGRKIASHELFAKQYLWMDSLNSSFVRHMMTYVGSHYYIPRQFESLDAFQSLIGNPVVFLAKSPKTPHSVQASRVSLILDSMADQISIRCGFEGVPDLSDCKIVDEREGFIVLDRRQRAFFIAPVEPRLMEMLRSLVRTGAILVPTERAGELFEALRPIQNELSIALPETSELPRVAGDATPVVRLNPTESGGLYVEIRVRPFDGETIEAPGAGIPQQLGFEGEKFVCRTRSMEEETERARGVLRRLGLPEESAAPDWRIDVATPDESLDLIAKLRDLGDGDAMIEWPEAKAVRVVGSITPAGLRVELTSQRDWFGLEGGFEIDGGRIDLASLMSSIRSGSRYVAVGPGKWAMIEQELRDRLLALSDAAHQSRSGGLQVGRTALPFIQQLEDLAVDVKTSREWSQWVDRLKAKDDADAIPDESLTVDLRDYQLQGYQWLRKLSNWGDGACLADDMGLGKTVQTLAVLVDRVENGPTLIIAPTSVCYNWVEECRRFTPSLKPILHRETDRAEIVDELGGGDLLITSYGLLRHHVESLSKRKWGTLVLDEAHFVKNAVTKTAQSVRSLDADWRLALTGTPLENHLGELWSLFRAVSPGLLGSWEQFKVRFAEPIEKQRDDERRQALARLIRPFVLRRRKDEVLKELPPRTESIRFAELSKQERKRYDEERLRSIVMLTEKQKPGEDKRFQVLAALTRLRQIACHPKLVEPAWKNKSSAKLDAFLEIVEELQEGEHKALVFSQFVQHLELIRQSLDDRNVKYLYLDGQTSPKRRKELVQAFQDGEADLFLISLKAGGTGLNLTAADYVIHMDPWWNPAVEDQASDRAHRIGQTKSVTVFRIVAKGTIEEQILSLHATKRQLVSDVLDGSDQAAKLSTDDLVELIRAGGNS